jgi:hypothetical protein
MKELTISGSRLSGICKLDSGQKPAGMTGFWSFARASDKLQKHLEVLCHENEIFF